MTRASCILSLGALASGACRTLPPTPASPDVATVANAGFAAPENVVYDSAADVLLVVPPGAAPLPAGAEVEILPL